MATTYTWIGPIGSAASGSIAADWSPSGGPPSTGDTAVIGTNGTVLVGDGPLRSETVILAGGRLSFDGDTSVTPATPSVNAASVIATNGANASTLDALDIFANQGTIQAAGSPGSSLSINVGTSALSAGYAFNSGVIEANAGNTLTIAIGANSELLNTGSIVANGGIVRITASPSAIAGGQAPVRGELIIKGGGTLETASAFTPTTTGSDPVYYFADATAGNTLKIDNVGSFSGRIAGFSNKDTIDLGASLAVGTLAYSTATSILNLESNSGAILASLLITSGAFGSGTFALNNGTADGFTIGSIVANGTTDTVLTTSLVTPVASGVPGAWQTAASWVNGVVPGTADTPLIGQGTSANFTLTTGSAPVTVAGLTITDPQATVHITSNVTAGVDGIVNRAGTLEVTSGNSVTAASMSQTEPSAAITIDSGSTVSLTGHVNTSLAAAAGTLTVNPGDNYGDVVSAGTLIVNGTLLGGPAPSGGGGGSTSIGYDGNGLGSVTVNAGGKVTDTRTLLGSDPTSSGSVTLTGAGASWTDAIDVTDTAHASGYIDVGYNDISANTPSGLNVPGPLAAAQLLITQGATLTDQAGGNIGASADSAGSVTVSTGGFWNLASNGIGYLAVGQLGSGVLSVVNGGSVAIGNVGTFYNGGTTFTAGGISIGNSIGATGTVNISGPGSQLSTPDGMSVGRAGQGLLSIQNGGTVQVTAGGIGIGQTAATGASGTIVVGGSGSPALLNLGSLAAGIGVGNAAPGTMTVAAGGTISLNGTAGIGIGRTAGATGMVTVSGGLITQTGTSGIGVGQGAGVTGTLQVLNGGTVAVSGGGVIGVGVTAAGSSGTITVQGAGSLIRTTGTGSAINIGAVGNGVLSVTNGGSVSDANALNIGAASGGAGTVTVNGGNVTAAALNIDSASSQTASGTLNIGSSGAVTISGGANVNKNGAVVMSGGVLTVPALTIGAGGELSGFGQVVSPGGLNNVGTVVASGGVLELSASAGSMTIAPGGTLTLDAGLPAGASVNFTAAGELSLGNSAVTGGTIGGFGAGDTISLAGINVTGSSYANGVLTLNTQSGNTQSGIVSLNLSGNFAFSNVGVTNAAGGAQVSLPGTGLLGSLNLNQQLELIYVAYFNRAADGPGLGFWGGQNAQAQSAGQSAAIALTNIANSFTPQAETIALYPFLGTPNLNLTTPAAQAGLTTFINTLYGNLFGHAPDSAGFNYWLGQITAGAVGLGAAALAIANGATGSDAIEVQNKLSVALDFTNRTSAAGLGESAPLSNSFLTAARGVLSGVDGASLNDASVIAGMNATSTFITGSTTAQSAALASTDPILVSTVGGTIDPGIGSHTIQFLAGASGDTLVLHASGFDQVSGFDPATDVLDLRSLLAEANVDLHGDLTALSQYVSVVDQGADALLQFDPGGQSGAATVAVLRGLGDVVTGLDTLVSHGAVRIT